jgi:hypothetical protein
MAKKQTENTEFVNPFEAGVNYETFLNAVGSEKVKDYCEGKLTKEQIEWLENDLKHYNLKK